MRYLPTRFFNQFLGGEIMKTVKNTIFLFLLIALPALAQRTTTPTRKPAAPAPPAKAAPAEPETSMI